MAKIVLNHEQQHALDKMLEGVNVFLTGKAGSGKSVVINEFINQCNRNLMVLAPTGIAAKNLVKGTTIHSGLSLPTHYLTKDWKPIFSKKVERLCTAIEIILIDEISMVRADIFNAIDIQLRYYNKSDAPFGGKQIIVIGDFFQLQPVVPNDMYSHMQKDYSGCFAFLSAVWVQADFANIYLQEVHRQHDKDDLALLNSIRDCSVSSSALSYRFQIDSFYRGDTINLCCYRRYAERINKIIVNNLKGTGVVSIAKIYGDFPCEAYPTDVKLHLKLDEKVMLLANSKGSNSDDKLLYANGDIGRIIDYNSSNNTVKVRLDNGEVATVGIVTFINYRNIYTVDEDGKITVEQHEKGRFQQLPLAPAYATTIHKSQGLTLNKAHVVLGLNGCFAKGQLYTALSRVKDFKNLTLDRPIRDHEIMTDFAVKEFYMRTFNHT